MEDGGVEVKPYGDEKCSASEKLKKKENLFFEEIYF